MSDDQQIPLGDTCHFFSVRLASPCNDLLLRKVDVVRDVVRLARQRWPFTIDAAVILPAQIMMVWTLPATDSDHCKRWRMIRSGFARHATGQPTRRIWQDGYWHHRLETVQQAAYQCRMIEAAPVMLGLVERARDWPFSSARMTAVGPDVAAEPAVPRSVVIPLAAGGHIRHRPGATPRQIVADAR